MLRETILVTMDMSDNYQCFSAGYKKLAVCILFELLFVDSSAESSLQSSTQSSG